MTFENLSVRIFCPASAAATGVMTRMNTRLNYLSVLSGSFGLLFFAGRDLPIPDVVRFGLALLGSGLFLARLVVVIQQISASIDSANRKLDAPIARSGLLSYVDALLSVHIQRSAQISEPMRLQPHLSAATDILIRHSEERLLPLAQQIAQHAQSSRSIEIPSPELTDDFLLSLVKTLPGEAVWLGTTHLTSSWRIKQENSQFGNFSKEIHKRSHDETLSICRIYCLASLERSAEAQDIIAEHEKFGVVTKEVRDADDRVVPDVSVVMVPRSRRSTRKAKDRRGEGIVHLRKRLAESKDPRATLKSAGYSDLCAMSFQTSSAQWLRSARIVSAEQSGEFDDIASEFLSAWRRASSPRRPLDRIDDAIESSSAYNHQFFAASKSAGLTQAQLEKVAADLLYWSESFPVALRLLIDRLDSRNRQHQRTKLHLCQIYYEETGGGDSSKAHSNLLRSALKGLGVSDPAGRKPYDETWNFVSTMAGIYKEQPLPKAMGAQYAFESYAVRLIADLNRALSSLRTMSRADWSYFEIHLAGEEEHRKLMRGCVHDHIATRRDLDAAVEGAHDIMGLFAGMWNRFSRETAQSGAAPA